jgi:hypothetical protein
MRTLHFLSGKGNTRTEEQFFFTVFYNQLSVVTIQPFIFLIFSLKATLHICCGNFSRHKIAKLSANNLICYKLTHLGNSNELKN